MIAQILNTVVLGDASLKALIEYTDRNGDTNWAFMPSVVEQGAPLPGGSYNVLSIDSVDTKDGFSGIERFRVQIDWYDHDYLTIEKLDGLARKAFNTADGEYTVNDFDGNEITVDVGFSRHDDTTDLYIEEVEAHARSTEYTIIINRDP